MDTVVKATTGRSQGTRPSRRLRETGQLPGVVYGLQKDPVPVSVTYTELREALRGEAGVNTVFTLDVEGEQQTVIVRDVQRDPIKRVVTHADFMRVDGDVPISLTVPLTLTGTAVEVAEAGALVEQKMFRLRISVLPRAIPTVIEADISHLTMDGRIAVGDLNLPDGVVSMIADRITVAAPVATRVSKTDLGEEDELLAGKDGEATEGGDAPSADGGDAGSDSSGDE